jgi:Family of unknown function (DUF5695)
MLCVSPLLAGSNGALPAPEEQAARPSYPPIVTLPFVAGEIRLALRGDTQTLARLSPAAQPDLDFVPGEREAERQADGYVHIGDLNLRLRSAGGEWSDFASAHARKPIRALPTPAGVLAAADITASMGTVPLRIERYWLNEAGALVLRFVITNVSSAPVEIGGLGMPMVFDNIMTDRTLEQAHARASFVDPYIGRDAGYLQVTRLNGKGPALLVLPEAGTPLEAYRPIQQASRANVDDVFTDRSQRSQTSEGFFDWTVVSKGFAAKEWAAAQEQWNAPTSFILAPGAARTIGVRFIQSPSIRAIEKTLIAQHRPVVVGIPGYVVPTDLEASLFIKSDARVTQTEISPAGAIAVTPAGNVNGWVRYAVRGSRWGRARLSITYADGNVQTVSYFVTKPLEQAVSDLGRFTTTKQWYDDPHDPFARAPAILTYDREADRIVTQEPRVWIAGMSDEGGAGSWVAAMMKQLDNPDRGEVAKLERLVNETVWGHLQLADGPHAGAVRKSLFYYDPVAHPGYYDPARNWQSWTSWSKKDAADVGRSYNYPHVAIGYWVLYRLARNHAGLVNTHDWRWYLDHAYQTTVAMMRDAPYYAQFGQMEGDVFVEILQDLIREGMTDEAREMERLMKARVEHWRTLAFPFGSEMAWDSTGQAEVYAWMRYFGFTQEADQTREVIEGYDPTIPHWGYNGNARRYWDFLYGGKVERIERQIHHYGSALNAVPLFAAYRADPAELHLLRVAYGGWLGGITNIDPEGFASAAFHSWPDQMRWDSYTGDYGMGFFGHAYAAATYLVKDSTFGWLAFGGNLQQQGALVRVVPKDGARARLFVAPAGVWIVLDAGKITSASYAPANGRIILTLDPADSATPAARIVVNTTIAKSKLYAVLGGIAERGARTIPLSEQPTSVVIQPQ